MKIARALASGFVGAISLTALHQVIRKLSPDAPRIDTLGVRAIEKTLNALGTQKPNGATLKRLSFAGDIAFNSIYYSFTAAGKIPLLSASALGIAAGAGTVYLPGPLGLGKKPSAKNNTTKFLSMGIYIVGGLAAAATYRYLNRNEI